MKSYKVREVIPEEDALTEYPFLLQRLLLARGITTVKEADVFLHPDYERDMNDPFLMHDMERAVVRIFEAMEAKEKIVVYSDYDCDGIPGAVILHDFFKKIDYNNVVFYIPDRHDEGYGLHSGAIEGFIADKVDLLITIDLGITAVAEVANAQANGIDVIITDHHIIHGELPKAFAIVNPKLGEYPDSMLCGAGVAFKLVQAFVKKYSDYFTIHSGWEKWLLDMAGLATLSDMVPLRKENRAIAYFGLKVLRKSPRPGLVALFGELKVNPAYLSEEDLTFLVTPRINAASRMDSPMRAFELLSANNDVAAKMLAKHLSTINDTRKKDVALIMKEVWKTLEKRELHEVIVIGNPSWRSGVLGLVAGKIIDMYNCPVFVWGQEGTNGDAVIKGSCRSDGSVNIVELMTEVSSSFVTFGGHELAGGFSVSREEVHFLEDKLTEAFHKVKRDTKNTESIMLDAKLTLNDVTKQTFRLINQLAPFGLGNQKPTFLFENVVVREIKLFGKEKNHLELTLLEEGTTMKAIAFFKTEESFEKKLVIDNIISLVATLELSYFAGRETLRLRIVDIQ